MSNKLTPTGNIALYRGTTVSFSDNEEASLGIDSSGNLLVNVATGIAPLAPSSYNGVYVTYPTGTTESYIYKTDAMPTGTLIVTYTDTTKGSITSVVKS